MSDTKRAEEAEQYASMLEEQLAEAVEQRHVLIVEGEQAVKRVAELEQELEAALTQFHTELEEAKPPALVGDLTAELTEMGSIIADLDCEQEAMQKQADAMHQQPTSAIAKRILAKAEAKVEAAQCSA